MIFDPFIYVFSLLGLSKRWTELDHPKLLLILPNHTTLYSRRIEFSSVPLPEPQTISTSR
jgi:hypothetical protein